MWSTKASCVPRVKSLLAEADERDQDGGHPFAACQPSSDGLTDCVHDLCAQLQLPR